MPYNWAFSRTYTFVHDLLTDEERALCRQVMKARGDEMYRHLYPRHLWQPYASHSNRAWHKLGEIGIAFLGEVEGAEDWVWFAANVFANVYPVWSDDDGGWHEGSSYWASYLERFSFWADTMKPILGLDAYRKPFFSKVGYYPMYLMPPGTTGGGVSAPPRRNSTAAAAATSAAPPNHKTRARPRGGATPLSGDPHWSQNTAASSLKLPQRGHAVRAMRYLRGYYSGPPVRIALSCRGFPPRADACSLTARSWAR